MTKPSPNNTTSNRNEDIPDYVYESLARSLLPLIQEYYRSEEGQQAFEAWKELQEPHTKH